MIRLRAIRETHRDECENVFTQAFDPASMDMELNIEVSPGPKVSTKLDMDGRGSVHSADGLTRTVTSPHAAGA